jgi:hypothetical protein
LGAHPIGWPEVALKALTILEPYIPAVIAILLLWALIRITDASIASTIRGIFSEFRQLLQGRRNLLTANALGGILLFVLTIFLFFGGLRHLIFPTTGVPNESVDQQVVYTVIVFFFGAYFILCLLISRQYR